MHGVDWHQKLRLLASGGSRDSDYNGFLKAMLDKNWVMEFVDGDSYMNLCDPDEKIKHSSMTREEIEDKLDAYNAAEGAHFQGSQVVGYHRKPCTQCDKEFGVGDFSDDDEDG